jgi:hypothetical protein
MRRMIRISPLLLGAMLAACAIEPDVPLPTDKVQDAAEAMRIASRNCPVGDYPWAAARYHWRIWTVTMDDASVEVWADNGGTRNCRILVVVT